MRVRPYPFDSGPPTERQKRLKTSMCTEDDGTEPESAASPTASSEIATLPLDVATLPIDVATLPLDLTTSPPTPRPASPRRPAKTRAEPISLSQIFSSPPPVSYPPTQATQLIDGTAEFPSNLEVQVAASSPIHDRDSPIRPKRDPVRRDGTVKPFTFYSARNLQPSQNKFIDLASDDGPQYIGSSSDEESDDDLVPDFNKTIASKAKVPSMRDLKARRGMEEGTKRVEKVEESPISLSRFRYQPPPQTFPSRLDSIKSSGLPLVGNLVGSYARSRPQQTRPDRAKALPDLHLEDIRDPDLRRKVIRIKNIMPMKSNKTILQALQQKKGNFDDACALLTEDEAPIDLVSDNSSKKAQGSTAAAAAAALTSKREARAPRKAITEKWSSTQARPRLLSSSPEVEVKPKRRLVKGSRNTRDSSPIAPIEIEDDDSEASSGGVDEAEGQRLEDKVLDFINTCELKDLIDIAATTENIAQSVLNDRPFKNIDKVRGVTIGPAAPKKGKRGGNRRPAGDKVVDACIETFRGYEAVDTLIKKCDDLGKPLAEAIRSWGVDLTGSASKGELEIVDINFGPRSPAEDEEGISTHGRKAVKFMSQQPKNLAPGVTLKDYQLVGINWLNMLYEKKLSCILADEMGLGKTCQVVAFFAHLLTTGEKGPHLVVVPASTLENWLREFKNFCPELNVEPYYGTQTERVEIQGTLKRNPNFNVLVTTYNLATGDASDRKFFRERKFNVCVYDEGHMLKNSSSSRYTGLMQLPAKFRLLLTGTPLQNNLQELASLLAFILPNVFKDKKEDLATIFKHKAKTSDDTEASNALLSATRIQKAKAMMTPFVLRRKKQQVLGKHLPEKTTRVEYCELSEIQKELYDAEITAAKNAIEARAAGKKPTKASSNLLMQLRKAAIHPFLFRRHFNDATIKKMSAAIMKEECYRNNDAKFIEEDMSVMNDFELNRLCLNFPGSLHKFAFQNDEWMNAGKVDILKRLVLDFKANGDRVLVFSQFTQVMDILESVLSTLDITFLRLDGSTKVEDRQDMIDQFYEEEDITAFLLSTKAGGFGINLACANKVIIFDSSFNPHDDRQAADRAHRVGQKRPVEVINLVTRGTIEEQILALANTKLALDQSVSGEDANGNSLAGKGEELVAKMLMSGKGEGTIGAAVESRTANTKK